MNKSLQKKVNETSNILFNFYGIAPSLNTRLVITNNGKFGTKDITVCGKKIVLEYCPNKLQQEFDAINLKVDFNKFLTYAFAESLSMGVQKKLMIKTCNKECNKCRGFNKAPQFKLANYILTYYAADQVISELWGDSKFGLKILKKINNKSAKKIAKALRTIYSNKQSQSLLNELSQKGNLTYEEILITANAKGLNKGACSTLLI